MKLPELNLFSDKSARIFLISFLAFARISMVFQNWGGGAIAPPPCPLSRTPTDFALYCSNIYASQLAWLMP
jgi:hypothetical protein